MKEGLRLSNCCFFAFVLMYVQYTVFISYIWLKSMESEPTLTQSLKPS